MVISINNNNEIINNNTIDKNIKTLKYVDSLPDDINDYQYLYKNGEFIKGQKIDFKSLKKKELEDYIYNLKEIGVEYNGLMFKCDDLASSRINKIITGTSVGANPFPLTWITRNSEQGVVVFNNRDEFIAFYTAFSMKELDIQVQEARLKMQIDLATTKEELDAIVFEMPVEETDPITEEVPAE